MKNNDTEIKQIIKFICDNYKTYYENIEGYAIDNYVSSKLPKGFHRNYKSIETPRDGNCMWHMISLCFFGNLNFSLILRIITVYTLINNKNDFIKLILKEESFTNKDDISKEELDKIGISKYKSLLEFALTKRAWGNEYHLLALSTALNTNIYIYSVFPEKWLNNSIEKIHENFSKERYIGAHLIYKPLNNAYTNNFICGQFGEAHYTALIPINSQVLELKPKSSFYI